MHCRLWTNPRICYLAISNTPPSFGATAMQNSGEAHKLQSANAVLTLTFSTSIACQRISWEDCGVFLPSRPTKNRFSSMGRFWCPVNLSSLSNALVLLVLERWLFDLSSTATVGVLMYVYPPPSCVWDTIDTSLTTTPDSGHRRSVGVRHESFRS